MRTGFPVIVMMLLLVSCRRPDMPDPEPVVPDGAVDMESRTTRPSSGIMIMPMMPPGLSCTGYGVYPPVRNGPLSATNAHGPGST